MPRKPKTVYQKIEEVNSKIASLEEQLIFYKSELNKYLKEKDELEMHQFWDIVKSKNLSIDDIKKMMS